MAIALETVASATAGASSSIEISKPAGVANGDVLVASLYCVTGQINSVPTGWELVGESSNIENHVYLYYKVISNAGAEPASYTWGLDQIGAISGGIARFSGVNTTTPEDVAEADNSGSGLTPTGSSITTVTAGAMLASGV